MGRGHSPGNGRCFRARRSRSLCGWSKGEGSGLGWVYRVKESRVERQGRMESESGRGMCWAIEGVYLHMGIKGHVRHGGVSVKLGNQTPAGH